MRGIAIVALLALCVAETAVAQVTQTPYAGEQHRPIKALSQDEVNAYMTGRGMGLAKAAELNGYPGPRHVIDLADQLDLSAAQRVASLDSFDRMHDKAVRLGKRIVEKERALDHLFAQEQADHASLRRLVNDIAQLQGELRLTHLEAHLEMKQFLNPTQIARYDELRGYGGAEPEHHHKSPIP